MNKKLLYILVGISSGLTVGLVGIFLLFIYNAEYKSVTQISSNIHSAYLQEMFYNYKNDLISGNYRAFRNQLASLMDHEIFSGYRLNQNGQKLDMTDDFDKKSGLYQYAIIKIPIWFDEARTNKWGEVELLVSVQSQKRFMTAFFKKIDSSLLWIFLMVTLLVLIYAYLWQKINFSLTRKVDQIFHGAEDKGKLSGFSIWQPMLDQLVKLKTSNEDLYRKNELNRLQDILIQLNRQVAHDIRSPLSALNMILSNIPEVGQEKIQIIKSAAGRINEIAEDLLKNGRNREFGTHNTESFQQEKKVMDKVLISDVVQSIVNEKQIILGINSYIIFEVDLVEAEDAIVNFNRTSLERVFSNLINNSIEAFSNKSGSINIRVAAYHGNVVIALQDNGKGIPESILTKLGQVEITSGKENGNGLGIFYAKKSIEEAGGTFEIHSRIDIGTMITIKLPAVD